MQNNNSRRIFPTSSACGVVYIWKRVGVKETSRCLHVHRCLTVVFSATPVPSPRKRKKLFFPFGPREATALMIYIFFHYYCYFLSFVWTFPLPNSSSSLCLCFRIYPFCEWGLINVGYFLFSVLGNYLFRNFFFFTAMATPLCTTHSDSHVSYQLSHRKGTVGLNFDLECH